MRIDRSSRAQFDRCPYCMRSLELIATTDWDHVIGRNFPPRGSLKHSWNLIVRTCRECNQQKASLESEISAVTLYQLTWNLAAEQGGNPIEARVAAEVARKGRTHSALTKRFVRESSTSLDFSARLGPAELSFGLAGPPQICPERSSALARFHVRGLGSFIFSEQATRKLPYLPPVFMVVAEASHGDWGNTRSVAFADFVRNWPVRLLVKDAADGHFSATIRKEPGSRPIWSWALEWNRTHRKMGFMGDSELALTELADQLPRLEWDGEHWTLDPLDGRVRYRWRTEIPVDPNADYLFEEGPGLN